MLTSLNDIILGREAKAFIRPSIRHIISFDRPTCSVNCPVLAPTSRVIHFFPLQALSGPGAAVGLLCVCLCLFAR